MILPKASCRECADITKKVENYCLRSVLGPFRVAMGIRTRRKKERPTALPLDIMHHDGTTHTQKVAVKDYPAALSLFQFGEPDILAGRPPSDMFHGSTGWVRHQIQQSRNVATKPNVKAVKIGEIHPGKFARMLAKIAHGYAYTQNFTADFTPLLPDLILGKFEYPSYFVGGSKDIRPPESLMHQLQTTTASNVRGKDYLVVLVRLFPVMATPDFLVVVGERPHQTS